MLKVWNVSLICGAFVLALVGTFLVRSGILQSIHAFGASTVGGWLLGLIAVVAIGSTVLIVSRLNDLRPERRISSALSREAIFLVNNLLLVGLATVVFWGTFFPLIAEAFTGERSSLGTPWFERYVTPIGVALVLFTGIGPLLAWGRFSAEAARRLLLWPSVAAIAAIAGLLVVSDAGQSLWALLIFGLAAFTITALGQEFWRAGGARRSLTGESFGRALPRAVVRNRRRYGGYVAHLGLVVMLIAVAASSSFQTNRDLRLAVGESAEVGDYTVTYKSLSADPAAERIAFTAVLDVDKDGRDYATLEPARNYYPTMDPSVGPVGRFFEGEATSEIGLRSSLGSDFWAAFQPDLAPLDDDIAEGDRVFADIRNPATPPAQLETLAAFRNEAVRRLAASYAQEPPPATFRVNTNPMVVWLWIGALMGLAGAVFAAWPTAEGRHRIRAAYEARIGRELKRA